MDQGLTTADELLTFDQVAAALKARIYAARVIAIDGLPCSGKSTLAERLVSQFGLKTLGFDDFYLPEWFWPVEIAPGLPFPFFRISEFREAVRALKTEGCCSYRPYDWDTGKICITARELRQSGPLIVEGFSVLDPAINPFYDLSVFVISDRATLMDAKRARDGDVDASNWECLFLPSADLYMKTAPQQRADIVVLGRGTR